MFDGLSAGGAESTNPNAEKQKAAKSVPMINSKVRIPIPNKKTPIKIGIKLIKIPNMKEAVMSPKIMAHIVIGDDTSLSKVFILVSQGAITGPTDETVKNNAIPIKPGIKNFIGMSLPIENERNRKEGSSSPNITTGPFR